MLTILFVLCLSLLDFQRPAIPDSIEKQFVVTELQEQTTTGCATSPPISGVQARMPSVDWVGDEDPHENAAVLSRPVPLDQDTDTPMLMPYNRPDRPNPHPEPSPVAVVPEPPTLAILTISATVLLYLLFCRQRKQKFYRRT